MYSPLVYKCFLFKLPVGCVPVYLDCPNGLCYIYAAGFFACYITCYCWPSNQSFLSQKLIDNSTFPSIGWRPVIVWVVMGKTGWVFLASPTLSTIFWEQNNNSPYWLLEKKESHHKQQKWKKIVSVVRMLTTLHWHLFHWPSFCWKYQEHHWTQMLCLGESALPGCFAVYSVQQFS